MLKHFSVLTALLGSTLGVITSPASGITIPANGKFVIAWTDPGRNYTCHLMQGDMRIAATQSYQNLRIVEEIPVALVNPGNQAFGWDCDPTLPTANNYLIRLNLNGTTNVYSDNFVINAVNGSKTSALYITTHQSKITASPSSSSTSSNATSSTLPASDGVHSSLSGGAIAGIVIGAIAGLILIIVGLFLFLRRSRQNSSSGIDKPKNSNEQNVLGDDVSGFSQRLGLFARFRGSGTSSRRRGRARSSLNTVNENPANIAPVELPTHHNQRTLPTNQVQPPSYGADAPEPLLQSEAPEVVHEMDGKSASASRPQKAKS